MKLAVTIWGNRISPVFDAARTLLVAEIHNCRVTRSSYTSIDPESPEELLRILKYLEIDTLICGAISSEPSQLIQKNAIRIIPFISGHALQFLDSFSKTKSIDKAYMMPGYSNRSTNPY